jgi:hypothetical protein
MPFYCEWSSDIVKKLEKAMAKIDEQRQKELEEKTKFREEEIRLMIRNKWENRRKR